MKLSEKATNIAFVTSLTELLLSLLGAVIAIIAFITGSNALIKMVLTITIVDFVIKMGHAYAGYCLSRDGEVE